MTAGDKTDGGFTIAELVITVALIGLLATPLVFNSFQFYLGIDSANRKATMYLESQAALRAMTEDLRLASGIAASNSITDPNNPSGWQTSSSNHVLIILSPAQDSSGNFIINPSTSAPYQNQIVYYNSGKTLYRRTLPYPVSGNGMTQSCPPSLATLTCPADSTLTSKFDTSTFTFYDASGTQTATPGSARSVKINLQIKDTLYGQSSTVANVTQVTFRNS